MSSSTTIQSRMFAVALGAVLALGAAGCVKKSSGAGEESGAKAGGEFGGKKPFPDSAPITDPPVPTTAPGNPLVGAKMFVDPQSLAMLRYARYGIGMLWRWVLGRPMQGGLRPPEPVTKVVREYQQRVPLGYASVSEQMNVAIVILLVIMAHV